MTFPVNAFIVIIMAVQDLQKELDSSNDIFKELENIKNRASSYTNPDIAQEERKKAFIELKEEFLNVTDKIVKRGL